MTILAAIILAAAIIAYIKIIAYEAEADAKAEKMEQIRKNETNRH